MVSKSRSRTSLARWRRWLWALLAGALIPVASLYGYFLGVRHEAARSAAFPVLGTAPVYTMTNQLGREVSSNSFRGKVQLVSFLFPYCTTMCPLIAAHLANLENLGLGPAGIENDVQIVSFNLDPADTGPKEMRAFLTQYGWNPGDLHWQYLIGSAKDIHRVVTGGFGVGYKRISGSEEGGGRTGNFAVVQPEVVNQLAERAHVNYDIVHDDVLEIVDQQGRIRKTYDNADTVDWRELLSVARSLVQRPG
ncbi:MAG TPA: SCO family protein [Stellaceae bacterium]|nr:SCO family protein [Stellaceae bacterium]